MLYTSFIFSYQSQLDSWKQTGFHNPVRKQTGKDLGEGKSRWSLQRTLFASFPPPHPRKPTLPLCPHCIFRAWAINWTQHAKHHLEPMVLSAEFVLILLLMMMFFSKPYWQCPFYHISVTPSRVSSGCATNIKRGTACTNKSRSTLHVLVQIIWQATTIIGKNR